MELFFHLPIHSFIHSLMLSFICSSFHWLTEWRISLKTNFTWSISVLNLLQWYLVDILHKDDVKREYLMRNTYGNMLSEHPECTKSGLSRVCLTWPLLCGYKLLINYETKGETLWFCYLCVCDDISHPFLELAFSGTQTCFQCVDSRNIPSKLDFYLFLIISSWLNLEREVCFRTQTCLKCGDSN